MEEKDIWLRTFLNKLESEEKIHPGGYNNIEIAGEFADKVCSFVRTKI